MRLKNEEQTGKDDVGAAIAITIQMPNMRRPFHFTELGLRDFICVRGAVCPMAETRLLQHIHRELALNYIS